MQTDAVEDDHVTSNDDSSTTGDDCITPLRKDHPRFKDNRLARRNHNKSDKNISILSPVTKRITKCKKLSNGDNPKPENNKRLSSRKNNRKGRSSSLSPWKSPAQSNKSLKISEDRRGEPFKENTPMNKPAMSVRRNIFSPLEFKQTPRQSPESIYGKNIIVNKCVRVILLITSPFALLTL